MGPKATLSPINAGVKIAIEPTTPCITPGREANAFTTCEIIFTTGANNAPIS